MTTEEIDSKFTVVDTEGERVSTLTCHDAYTGRKETWEFIWFQKVTTMMIKSLFFSKIQHLE